MASIAKPTTGWGKNSDVSNIASHVIYRMNLVTYAIYRMADAIYRMRMVLCDISHRNGDPSKNKLELYSL